MARYLPLVAAVLVGALIGLGGFTFVYGEGHSYLRDDPEACGNCHIMSEHLDAWRKASHRSVATCNDCHTPHDPVDKWIVKARNGFWHSFYFTTGDYPDPLRITPPNHEVTEESCRYCHGRITEAIEHGGTGGSGSAVRDDADDRLTCTRCHRYVGHWVR